MVIYSGFHPVSLKIQKTELWKFPLALWLILLIATDQAGARNFGTEVTEWMKIPVGQSKSVMT